MSYTIVPTKGDDNNNNKANDNKINSTSTSSYYKESSDIPRRPSTKRQRIVSFKSQFEQIFMNVDNHNEIIELFGKKELTWTEKKHIDTVVQAFVSREFPIPTAATPF